MRGELFEILHCASKEGLIGLDIFQFLKEDANRDMPVQVIVQPPSERGKRTQSDQKALVLRNQQHEAPFQILNQIANALSSHDMEAAAVNVFGFSKRQVRAQKKLSEQQLMFSLLCSWWQIQQGPGPIKMQKLVERLTRAQEKGLLRKAALKDFRETLVPLDKCNSTVEEIEEEIEPLLSEATPSDSESISSAKLTNENNNADE